MSWRKIWGAKTIAVLVVLAERPRAWMGTEEIAEGLNRRGVRGYRGSNLTHILDELERRKWSETEWAVCRLEDSRGRSYRRVCRLTRATRRGRQEAAELERMIVGRRSRRSTS